MATHLVTASENTGEPSVVVCVLNWNGRHYLDACLTALAAQTWPNVEVILVDNGSTDGSVPFIRHQFPDITIRETGRNLGFAAGNNTILRELTADFAVLVNPDVILAPDCLEKLIAPMAANPAIGISGAKLWYPGGQLIQHAGGYITPPRGMPGHFGIGETDLGQFEATTDVDYVIGAAMAIRREILAAIGVLDETYFLFFEDVDLCFRARRAGYRVVYQPQATAIHVESATAIKGSFAYLQRFHTGRWIFLLKHFAVEQILSDTIPAEEAWLDQLGWDERQAAAVAYRAALYHLPAITRARAAEEVSMPSAAAYQQIEAGLTSLHHRTLTLGGVGNRPAAMLDIDIAHPQSLFSSPVPLIGPLIARLRTAWNHIAGRWYIDHVRQQQAEFNRMVLAHLQATEEELLARQTLIETMAINQIDKRRQAKVMAAKLDTLRGKQ